MWESPINVMEIQDSFVSEIKEKTEEMVFTEIKRIGIDVNKEELIKALQYDREQYQKGYSDGYAEAINDFVERLKEEYKPFGGASEYDKMACAMVYRRFDKIAHELKGESDE